ncbi:chromosomal replication initiator DnaA [Maribius pontilimi]|uniref:Chromosomal replication initiator DnaA n=1 Tax=Palleronia pontilimi TaxID=1964209 RepID=A0A934MC15_9RHOB|nr:DnaA/Hda family protein [Palleronia pontilimi]MBJ3762288.1 chromosomal replication initiator DnaA [Palleronia pontilimi]
MAEQLPFELPVRPALGREDFFVSSANAAAVGLIDGDARWPGGKLALAGPEASGKTHLAHVWADRVDGVVVAADHLARLNIPTLAGARHVAVEDVPRIAGQRKEEAALFHLHNLLLGDGGRLLFTGRDAPTRWSIRLPDLRSRLVGTTLVTLELPDDALLAALLRKQFHDRQLDPSQKLIDYIVPRMTRSGAEARRLVHLMDRLSLNERRPLSTGLARRALQMADPSRQGYTEDPEG